MDSKNNCLLCGAELVYFDEPKRFECCICHKKYTDNAACINGHYVCNNCHSKKGVELIIAICRSTPLRDPILIMQSIMKEPCIHMHGPEHHVLVGAALLAAYHNCGGKIELDKALAEMKRRGKQLPGGICGFWGCCGAAVSAGIFVSIATGSTPLKDEEWKLSNKMTAAALSEIAASGGPRCCKRDSFAAAKAAVKFASEHLGAEMQLPEKIVCTFMALNEECLGASCPFHPLYNGQPA